MYYEPKHFAGFELVSRDVLERLEGQGLPVWLLFDGRILRTADMLRERHGPMIANTWRWPDRWESWGLHHYRGFRPFDAGVGSEWSQHKFGRALDLVPLRKSAEEVRQEILNRPHEAAHEHITCVEAGVPWLHVDCRSWDKDRHGILIVNP